MDLASLIGMLGGIGFIVMAMVLGGDLSIFVGDLAPDVSDALLHETFSEKYPSVKAAKVVLDANTGRSKGYGFVRFGDENERTKAMTEMNGVKCSSRAMRIGPATPRKTNGYQQQNQAQRQYTPQPASQVVNKQPVAPENFEDDSIPF